MAKNKPATPRTKEQIAITYDLEMSRHYPKRGITEWDFQKGNLDSATKPYALATGKIAAQQGARLHFFAVGRVLEQANVDWLIELSKQGHAIGNHTYDHINVHAATPEATLPANKTAAHATNQSVTYAALNLLITQESWNQLQRPRRRQLLNNESP